MGILWYSLCFLFCELKGKWQFEKLNYILYINKKNDTIYIDYKGHNGDYV